MRIEDGGVMCGSAPQDYQQTLLPYKSYKDVVNVVPSDAT
jgi:hypothetical protein